MNKKSLFPIIALCAVIGLLVTACKDDDPEPPASTFTVAFNSNGGSSVASKTGVASGATIQAPTAPTKGTDTFGGWYKESTLTTPWNFATDTVTANITLYAKWTETEAPTTFTVTFDSKDGSAVNPITGLASGAKINEPDPAPTKEGFTFGGWYKEATFENEWDFESDTVTENITLYAKWTETEAPATFTVTFDSKDGSAVNPITGLASGAKINEPDPAPTKEGFTFGGWYKEATFENEWDFESDTVTENTTLYAKWTEN